MKGKSAMDSGRSVAHSIYGFFTDFVEMKRHFRYHSYMHLGCSRQRCRYCQQEYKASSSS
ncbi:hypothetical protein Ngar_c07520 [Candidatus Nitrososphaera gargensis Ga9.2]|uniref:Uncharacterized protein n=1 Tax=Nitrososphaera gargensis (strain Ga9.2) TaxID=1237085 RepID=K0IDH4_NITGG|nr:hypothetical protein Ngar_c07520 [Candidatus Nitrososphaera gargensis Ga9.2]